ncbi:YjjG family noncanonical pyrimidine nucleotidase [Bergeyella sp. RCAD1439]|uniref:YjjG family noncanonical pyrimidine nucleotidase n=1 Tax=Bergeyella anatis TaxID=3113737 RepID=UPI002E178427|nr:YjjG family noncanonical pyrimidine nucleotidase [Bergeyella sp. RCAD1439]
MIRHLFFDLDNTLWDHRKNAYLTLKELFRREALAMRYALDFEAFHRVYFTVNERLWAQIRDGEIDKAYLRAHRFYDTFLAFGIDDRALADRFESEFLDEILYYNELVDGALALLDDLSSRGYRLHILSNGFQEVTHRKCELSGIKRYFDTITSADEIQVRKPQEAIFAYALAKAGAQKGESLMIGDDWVADVQGSFAFGMKAVFFDVFREGNQAPGVKVVRHLSEIPALLCDFYR